MMVYSTVARRLVMIDDSVKRVFLCNIMREKGKTMRIGHLVADRTTRDRFVGRKKNTPSSS